MSINKHIPTTGLVLDQAEQVLMQKKNVDVVFKNLTHSCDIMKGEKNGEIYLTNFRLIFVNNKKTVTFHDVNMPFNLIKDFDIHQPTFGANHLRGRILAEENGGWEGSAEFDFTFKKGGAIDIGKKIIELATSPPQPLVYPIANPIHITPSSLQSMSAVGSAPPPYSELPSQGNDRPPSRNEQSHGNRPGSARIFFPML